MYIPCFYSLFYINLETQKSAIIQNEERLISIEKRNKAEQIICNFLIENKGKAFTSNSLNNRCLELQQLGININEINSFLRYLHKIRKIGMEEKETELFFYAY